MKRFRVLWQAGALSAVVIVSVVNLGSVARRVPPPPVPVPGVKLDPATQQHERLSGVRRELAARNIGGVISYLADRPAEQIRGDAAGTADYYLAQFVLLPVVLDLNSAAHEWAVANWQATPASVPAGWKVEKDFGAGVFLLRREAR